MDNLLGAGSSKKVWHVSDDELLCYVDGELGPKQAANIRDHLEACWTCRAKMEKIQQTIAAFVDYLNCDFAPNLDPPPRQWRTFRARMARVIVETGEPSAPYRRLVALRSVLSTSSLPLKLAAGLALTMLVAFLGVVLFDKVPRISAERLIQRAEEVQAQRTQAVPEPVVYQRLRVRQKSKGSAQDNAITWEIWNDVSNDRFKQRAGGANGQRSIDSQARKASRLVARRSRNLGPQQGNSRPAYSLPVEPATIPPMLQELERILRTNQMDPWRPVSAASYRSWRKSVRRDSEEIRDTSLPDGDRAYVLSTAAAGPFAANAIIKAALVVRSEDWHPVEQRLEVQGEDGVRDYELTETAFEVVSLNNLNPSIFADLTWPTPSAPASRPATASRFELPTGPELVAEEINARYALHRLRACVGESIEVVRDSASHVEVRGVVETPERKQQLLTTLQALPFVRADIQAVGETGAGAPSLPASPNGPDSNKEGSVARQSAIIQVQSGKLPIEDQLREYFARLRGVGNSAQEGDTTERAGVERQIIDLSNQAVSLSLAASAEAGALRQLAENYPPAEIRHLDAASRWLVEVMVRDHLAALRKQMERARALLTPILSSFEGANPESPPGGDTRASDLSDLTESTWAAWTLHVFATVQHVERLTDYLFAGGSLPAGQEEAVAELLADFNGADGEFQRLQARVNKDFSGRPQMANVKDQPE